MYQLNPLTIKSRIIKIISKKLDLRPEIIIQNFNSPFTKLFNISISNKNIEVGSKRYNNELQFLPTELLMDLEEEFGIEIPDNIISPNQLLIYLTKNLT